MLRISKMLMPFASVVVSVFLSLTYIASSESYDLTPEQAVTTLRAGNERFVAGHPNYPNLSSARRDEVAAEQHPYAAVLSCADSRVAPELLFDAGLGEIFVVRVAGNVADEDEIASLEYAVEHLHVAVITVLGHSQCGAVKAVVTGAEVHGSIPGLIDNIIPAVEDARAVNGKKSEDELVAAAVQANVFQSIADLLTQSEIIREHVAEGKTRLIGGVYSLASGAVNWMGQHPDEAILLANHHEEFVPPQSRKYHFGMSDASEQPNSNASTSAFGTQQPDGITSRVALTKLIEGNLRFADDPEGSVSRPNRSKERRNQLAKGQRPWAAILTCSDSRVTPEHLFDVGLGDLFVVRVAGNVADVDEIGSLEYAVGHLKTPLIVVMGHTSCGAVTAACNGGELTGHLPELLVNMEPAVERASHRQELKQYQNGDAAVDKVTLTVRENVYQSISDLILQSPEIMAYVQAGVVRIVGAIYHLENGRVEWLGEHPDQPQLVASLLVDQQLGIELEEVVAPTPVRNPVSTPAVHMLEGARPQNAIVGSAPKVVQPETPKVESHGAEAAKSASPH